MDTATFTSLVWEYYHQHGRELPWRQPEPDGAFDGYKVMVSEIMLQQTQVGRVIEKYRQFLEAFPTIKSLAEADLASVLVLWSGLGYNRRAKFLWQAAKILAEIPQPWSYGQLVACPGIGPNTAAAIRVYTYNQPEVFIETNIRTVYIHHFLADEVNVSDVIIEELVEQSLDRQQPREFFWALMDYGTHLKATIGNRSQQSKHYSKQSTFEGSKRQLRGAVLRSLAGRAQTVDELSVELPDVRLKAVVAELVKEGFLSRNNKQLQLGGE